MFMISGFTDEVSSSFDTQLALAGELGMKYICPRTVDKKNITRYSFEEFEQLFYGKMQGAGIGFSSIGSPIGKIKWNDDAAFLRHKEQLRTLIRIAEKTGCKYIRIFSFFVESGFDDDAVYPSVLRKTKEFVDIVQEHDVILLHENEKGIYGDIPERVLKLHRDVGHEQYKLCYDASNYIQCGVEPFDAYIQTKADTAYYHMKDCEDGVEVPLGTGQGRIKDIIADLAGTGFDGFVTMEPHTAKYALLRKLYYALPFLDKKAVAVYRKIDSSQGLTGKSKVSRKDVFVWQRRNLTKMLDEVGAEYE